ncbi:chlorite dismutase family protein, partial [Undibacterium sp.]|uniref:chlorite dismutase family protein n=1 Tax=Undibacterium sp. TaxID=1914977 RepID=UPI00374CC56D
MDTRMFSFVGGDSGYWRIVSNSGVAGTPLAGAARLDILPGMDIRPNLAKGWALRGITSNERYVTREEKDGLLAVQQGLGRPECTYAALIPIRKSAAWWALTPDERRRIFEEQSRHNGIGMHYLPAVARKLYHCRDLSDSEPFDFLTWFEFAPEHESAFNRLLAELRASD